MTGFSADWLALREPADHRARNSAVLSSLKQHFAGRSGVTVVDLGAGSGSNLRGCSAHLPQQQRWRLVDYDNRLIAAARAALSDWSGTPPPQSDQLALRHDGRTMDVTFAQIDLAANLEHALDGSIDLVTAAAFFDLVSPEWIWHFVATLATRRLPLYAVLIYNGEERWSPAHPADADINAAFNRHQGTDKGFGPAAGPSAAGLLESALRSHGYDVISGDSPWRLGDGEWQLMSQLADGIAFAAGESGAVPSDQIEAWRDARHEAGSCVIGHTDLLALPPD